MNKVIIREAFSEIPRGNIIFTRKLGYITERIELLMTQKGIANLKELAALLGEDEPEVSKWFNTLYDISLKTIAKIEAVLDADIIEISTNQCL